MLNYLEETNSPTLAFVGYLENYLSSLVLKIICIFQTNEQNGKRREHGRRTRWCHLRPIKLTPLSYLWNDFSDSRWMEPAPTAISEEHLNSILAVTNQMTRGLERVIEPPVEVVIAPSNVGSHFAHYV